MSTPAENPFIEIRDLHKKLGAQEVLRGVNLTVRRGETLMIIGPSGEGKTVMIKHIIGLMRPDSGAIFVDGVEVNKLRERELAPVRKRVSMLFQGAALFDSLTVAENVAFPLREAGVRDRDEIKQRVHEALEAVDLDEHKEKLPVNLSGGMRKRAGIARALALDPEILFLDEPSAGLDPLSARRLDDLILQLRDSIGSTIVIVTHELASMFKIATTALFLDTATKTQGAIGNPNDLRDHSGNPGVRLFLNRGETPNNNS